MVVALTAALGKLTEAGRQTVIASDAMSDLQSVAKRKNRRRATFRRPKWSKGQRALCEKLRTLQARELARRVGCSESTLSKLASGACRGPTGYKLRAGLARELGIPLGDWDEIDEPATNFPAVKPMGVIDNPGSDAA
jgi:transcriptional regulator with XRE-family HTH domain